MRIAIAPVGTTGDVAPFAILARSLVERGHEVTAVTWPVHGAALAQPGVRVEAAGPHADPLISIGSPPRRRGVGGWSRLFSCATCTSPTARPTAVDPSPSLVRIAAVDHRALLPRAALAVHHGGAGTTHAVAAAGIPSVVIPHVGDQRYWADRLHRLGVAPRPVELKRLDAASLAETTLAAAADERMRDRAQKLAARIVGEDDVSVSVTMLEEAASKG